MKLALTIPFVLALSGCYMPAEEPADEGLLKNYKTVGPDKYGVVCYERFSSNQVECIKVQ